MKTVTAGDARIPALGFGTWQLRGAEATDMVTRALSEGWRHVDTARMYGNEAEVGAGLRASGVPREQVRQMTPRLQALLGYDVWPPFMGHVTASHPAKTLEDGWVPPVLRPASPG